MLQVRRCQVNGRRNDRDSAHSHTHRHAHIPRATQPPLPHRNLPDTATTIRFQEYAKTPRIQGSKVQRFTATGPRSKNTESMMGPKSSKGSRSKGTKSARSKCPGVNFQRRECPHSKKNTQVSSQGVQASDVSSLTSMFFRLERTNCNVFLRRHRYH